MACEDFPCCGHEMGCCPDFDEDTGEQLNMKCTCGAVLPLSSPYSICRACMHDPECQGCGECHRNERDDDDGEESDSDSDEDEESYDDRDFGRDDY